MGGLDHVVFSDVPPDAGGRSLKTKLVNPGHINLARQLVLESGQSLEITS